MKKKIAIKATLMNALHIEIRFQAVNEGID